MYLHYTLLFLLLVGHFHLEVGKTLVPVFQSVHTALVGGLTHTGGSSIEIKINGIWKGPFMWHHHEDRSSMMPVNKKIHDAIKGMHLGGKRLMDSSKDPDYSILQGFFSFE